METTRDRSFFLRYAEIEIADRIGGGASSVVYKAYWKKQVDTKETPTQSMFLRCPVAVKKWFDPTCDAQTRTEFESEVMIVRELRHPNVVQFLGAGVEPPNLCLVMEYLPTSLFDVLHASSIEIDDRRVSGIAIEIIRAIVYLHDHSPPIVHRDLKPANLLLDRTWKTKLCDFGLAANTRSQRCAGTMAYMAPELLDPLAPFNEKIDVYAFGVILNEMIGRRVPFDGLSNGEIKRRVISGERPEILMSCPPIIRRLIESCWKGEAEARPTAREILDVLQNHTPHCEP